MQHVITPYAQNTEHWAWWESAFTDEQLTWLQNLAKSSNSSALVGNGNDGRVDSGIRRTKVYWLKKEPDTSWVFEILSHIVSELNAKFFRFDLTGFGEHIQLGNYESSEEGMYGWHVDMGQRGPSRKLSLVMQLSDPVDYEGGVLEIQPYGEQVIRTRKQRGLIVAFPSWTLHQVTPVTQGSRQSLVAWISGPPFK